MRRCVFWRRSLYLTDSRRSGSPAGTSLHAPEPGVSLGLNIVDFRVQLGVNRWLRTALRLRDGDLPLIKAFKGATSYSKPVGIWRMSVSK